MFEINFFNISKADRFCFEPEEHGVGGEQADRCVQIYKALCFFLEVKKGESKGLVPHLSVKQHFCPSLKRWAEIEKMRDDGRYGRYELL